MVVVVPVPVGILLLPMITICNPMACAEISE